MANPFPGMDPYLEGDLWTTVHTDLCAEIARQLAPKVRPEYAALSTRIPTPIPHVSLEIRDVAERRLVTCIEVLSPSFKRAPGREDYAAKRCRMLLGPAYLVEIDLLRAGTRFLVAQQLPESPYLVFVSRADRRPNVEVWPCALEQPLPTIPIPLLPGDAAVPLDLQQALSVVYEIIGCDDLADYSQPPPGPLNPRELTWVEQQLQRAGRRKPPTS